MKRYFHYSVLLTLWVTVLSCNYFSEKMSGDLPKITTEALAAGIANKSLYVFDNNTTAIFAKNHIPTAVYMDPRQQDASLLPSSKQANLVFYCKNTWCMASHAGARFAIEQGYANSRVYSLGIDGWIEAGQAIESAQ